MHEPFFDGMDQMTPMLSDSLLSYFDFEAGAVEGTSTKSLERAPESAHV